VSAPYWEWNDLEVIRVGDTYYYTGSTMHYSPGAPVLRSYDLVNWEFIQEYKSSKRFDIAVRLRGHLWGHKARVNFP
jgi:beta-xylosidase